MKRNISVACVACNGNKVLVALRCPSGDMGGRWEFPGGKVEEGETDSQAVIREFCEEFGVQVTVGSRIADAEFMHNGKTCCLHAYQIFVPHDGMTERYVLTEHTDYKWIPVSEIENISFVDSDMKIYPAVKQFIEKR